MSVVPRKEVIAGLAKGLAIVELFGRGIHRLTVAEAARGADLSRAAARRCLLTLTELGYLAHDGKYFTPRARLYRLGGVMIDRMMLARQAQPIVEETSRQLEESISLAVLDAYDSLFIVRAEAPRIVLTGVRLGARMPACATATGRLLLGMLDDEEIRAYLERTRIVARTPLSITDPEQIFQLIVEARATGYCLSDQELELGMRAMAVAVPVRGIVMGAMSLSTLSVRMSLADMDGKYRPVLEQAARRLSAILERDG